MLEVLRIGREKMSDKGTKSANKRVDPMRSQTGMTRDAILESFAASFAQRHRSKLSDYTEAELEAASRLVEEKFATPEWTHRVP
jgi:lipoate-protein ligase A